MQNFQEIAVVVVQETSVLKKLLYKLNNQLGKQKAYRFLKQLLKKVRSLLEKCGVRLPKTQEIEEIQRFCEKISHMLRKMLNDMYLIQFSALSLAIVSRVHFCFESLKNLETTGKTQRKPEEIARIPKENAGKVKRTHEEMVFEAFEGEKLEKKLRK